MLSSVNKKIIELWMAVWINVERKGTGINDFLVDVIIQNSNSPLESLIKERIQT